MRTGSVLLTFLWIVLISLAPGLAGAAGVNMIGRQSQNEGMLVLPAPARVTIDGDLGEWDWSGRIWVFADRDVRSRYSVEAAAMWDARNLYLAAKWKDPTPMYSTIDPDFNPNDGWKSDSWQMRVRTDRVIWITTWFFTPKRMPVMHIDYWLDPNDSRGEHEVVLLRAEPGGTDLGRGAAMAYREDADGKGFAQEIRIPWTIIYSQAPEIKPGLVFRMGHEFLWGDPTGRTWPIHRYADNMQPGYTSREFYWTAVNAWGDATLVPQGNVPVRQYVGETAKLEGTVPIRLAIPKKAARFTVAINDAQGNRVRNLAGDFIPEDYLVEERGESRVVEVKWDCLDEKGILVQPGTYQVVGLTHEGLAAEYEMCFYNPGTPPWQTQDGSGAWGADHSPPLRVARAGDWMIVSWAFAEGGSGIIGIGPDGRKRWGEKRGGLYIAADESYVYAIPAGWHIGREVLCRLGKQDGSYRPFQLDGQARPFELPVADIFGGQPPGKVVGLAAHGGRLALSLSEGKIALLDADSARLTKLIEAPGPAGLAFDAKGTLYALLEGKLHRVDTATGQVLAIATPGVVQAAAIATDNEGNIVLADTGPDSQVKAFSPMGKLVYTCGKKGGRPIRGPFDEQAMVRMSSVAVDSRGQIWVVESWDYPRRVSVWGRDGKLIRDYIGNTGYAGTGCYLHDQDPTLAYCGPIEFKLDKQNRTWKVSQILWVPDREKGEAFVIPAGSAVHPQRFTSSVSGEPREYLYTHDPRDGCGHTIFMERNGRWQPVAAVCYVAHISGTIDHNGIVQEEPSGEFAGLGAYDGCFWNDENGDGKAQRSECVIVPSKDPGAVGKRGTPALRLTNGWGGRIGPDLVFYTDGLVRYRPIGFTPDGAPKYGPEAVEQLNLDENGDLVPVPDEHLLLCLSFKGYGNRTTGMLGVDDRSGNILWSYPNLYPGVHGSHRATMPEPGLLIGPLKVCGVAEVSDGVGRVFAMRGNLGQDFFMTTDGLYVGAMFRDGRLPGEPFPNREESLRGMPMEVFSNGGEPFNGWFGKQADGKIRMTTGMPREAAMILEVKGLETIQRFRGPEIRLDMATIMKANADNIARQQAALEPKSYTVKRIAPPVTIDADPREWREVAELPISSEGPLGRASAKLAYDDAHLYVLFDVQDPSPWLNEGKDYTRLFKTGDAVDLQLGTAPAQPHRDPIAGDLRIVFSQLGGKPVGVLMQPVAPNSDPTKRVKYESPVGEKVFERVEVLSDARVAVKTSTASYRLEAAIPLATLGLVPRVGLAVRGDVGVISSDAQGRINVARTYWSNKATGLVSDLPQEAWLYPGTWGEMVFGP